MRIIALSSFLASLFLASATAQIQLQHDKKVYVSADKKVYINKDQPIYFRISTSPDANAPSYILPSEQTAQYANPMYFDTEGRNTLRSPSAVDSITKKTILPKQDVQFDMYADGINPATTMHITGSDKHISHNKIYYGQGLKMALKAKDGISGVDKTYISINETPYTDFAAITSPFEMQKEYTIKYYSVDNVGNVEVPLTISFETDYTAPLTNFKILGESKGNVLSSKASISLTSIDTLSGVKAIMYSINDASAKVYTAPIPLSVLKDGKSKIRYYAIDYVGNKEEERIIAASTETMGENTDASAFSFYIDKEAPTISSEIIGDQHKGKQLYISARSKFQINAIDEKSGVDKVLYSINNSTLKDIYAEPFTLNNSGAQSIFFASSDNVGNFALAKTQQLYVDASQPSTKHAFIGNQYKSRDTLFITSNTKLSLTSIDAGSGISSIKYIIDGKTPENYTQSIQFDREGFHSVEYGATDNVNNAEETKKCTFIIDNTPPQILYHFSVKEIGEKTVRNEKYTIYPSNAMLYLAATDNNSGSESISYRVNDQKETLNQIPIKGFTPGNYQVEVLANDVLKNKTSLIIRFSIEK